MKIQLECGKVWGGVGQVDGEIHSFAVSANIYSQPADGARGGDIYYASVCQNDRLTRLAMADLRGHGEQVSELSQWVYQALESHINSKDGAGVLTDLNSLVCQRGFQAITTAIVAAYYLNDSRLYFAYAGHSPLLLRRRGRGWSALPVEEFLDQEPQLPGLANLPLGMFPTVRYDQADVEMLPGDRVFLYTDGIPETPNNQGEFFGEDRLVAFLEQNAELPADELKARLIAEVREFSGLGPEVVGNPLPHDDCTFLVMELRQP